MFLSKKCYNNAVESGRNILNNHIFLFTLLC